MYFEYGSHRLDGPDTKYDYFEIDGVTFQALQLDVADSRVGRGINSTVFSAVEAEDDSKEYALKVSNFDETANWKKAKERRARFEREIRAMYEAKAAHKTASVVEIVGDGYIVSGGIRHRCFLMEKAEMTLKTYLESGVQIALNERLLLCLNIGRGILALHDIGLYHRDIKPENILQIQGGWKIGDLGLVASRPMDMDGPRERIGSIGWMCPEAINKKYAVPHEGMDILIDELSDAHQLGKLFWYILQGDIPNGCIKCSDFPSGSSTLFGCVLKPLLRYKREERPKLGAILRAIEPMVQLC